MREAAENVFEQGVIVREPTHPDRVGSIQVAGRDGCFGVAGNIPGQPVTTLALRQESWFPPALARTAA